MPIVRPTQLHIAFGVLGLIAGLLTSACDETDCVSDLTVSASDPAGLPVPGARVELLGSCCDGLVPPDCLKSTDERGEATVRAATGEVCSLLVSSADHESVKVDVPTECQGDQTVDVVLVRK